MNIGEVTKWLAKCSPMDGSDFAEACDIAADKLDEINKWANAPSGIKDPQHRAGYEHAQFDILRMLNSQ